MRDFWRGARAAVVFLTRIPIGGFPYTAAEWRWSSAWFPLVGAMLGGVMSLVWVVVRPTGPLPAATIAFAVALLMTGGFHEDGLADTADALGGATTRERIFEILKDSRIGSFGGLALVVSLLLRVTLVARLADHAVAALVLSQSIARLPPVWLMAALPYVTPDETVRSKPVARASWRQGVWATVLAGLVIAALAVAGVVSVRGGVLAVAAASLGAALAGYRFHRRAGGLTGDFLGAAEQVGECAVLVTLALLVPASP